ncbi:hypothetical protein ACWA7J_17095 [Leptothrix sp. BB-4]
MVRRAHDYRVTDRLRLCLEADNLVSPDWAGPELADRVIPFTSRAEPETPTFLVRDAVLVREVLSDARGRFSNRPYTELGGGDFMLAMDGSDHANQRDWVVNTLFGGRAAAQLPVQALARLAWDEAAVQARQNERVDAVALARDAALRFVAYLFGFPQDDLPLLNLVTRQVYAGLVHVILGRHISLSPVEGWRHDPGAAVRERVLRVIGDHGELRLRAGDPDPGLRRRVDPLDLQRCDVLARERARVRAALERHGANPADAAFMPLCARLAGRPAGLPGEPMTPDQQAAVVLGLLGGTVGNVQTSVGLIVDRLLDAGPLDDAALRDAAWATLAVRPPVAFLPRRVAAEGVVLGGVPMPPGANLVLWLGAPEPPPPVPGPGMPDWRQRVFTTRAPHDCIGDHLVMPLLLRVSAGILRLPGLAREWDELEGRPKRLDRRWFFDARTLPLRHAREQSLLQQPLCVVMEVREPLPRQVDELTRLIACAVPLIEQSLLESRHIHAAWFVLLDGGRRLALFTVYDGGFDPYIEYFAGRVGPLFDLLFQHIVDAPVKQPIGLYPREFVARIRKAHAHQAPLAACVYSDLPQAGAADVQAAEAWAARQLGTQPLPRPLGGRPDARQRIRRAAHDALLLPVLGRHVVPGVLARQAGLRLALRRHGLAAVLAALPPDDERLIAEARCLHDVMRGDDGVGRSADSVELCARIRELVDCLPQRVEAELAAGPGQRVGPDLTQPEARALADRLVATIRARPQPGRLQPLTAVWRVRAPHRAHALELRALIARSAPLLQQALHDTGRVRYAWFSLIDDGRQLAFLAVAQRGPLPGFRSLAADLADRLGDLFDSLFEHVEGAPARPVVAHREAFIDHLLGEPVAHAPVGGYFFNACPVLGVADIRWAHEQWRARRA